MTVVRLNSCIRAVAYGCSDGTTSIDLFSPVHDLDTQVTKYLVREAQNITVSALEWDQGGETLYIGYNNGKIVQVSFQFEKVIFCTYCMYVCHIIHNNWVVNSSSSFTYLQKEFLTYLVRIYLRGGGWGAICPLLKVP